jgi:hypothetical protein
MMLLIFFAGFFASRGFSGLGKHHSSTDSTVLLEQIKAVTKLSVVDGYFSEVISHNDFWIYDFGPFQKKMLVRVKARVSYGYDFDKIGIKVLENDREVTIPVLPEPEILYLEHELDYYDIDQGLFNSFTTEDYNKVNQKAKEYIRSQAEKSPLKLQAKERGESLKVLIKDLAKNHGFKVAA